VNILKNIGIATTALAIAISLSFMFWFFLLAGFPDPDPPVQGVAAKHMSRDEARDLLNYHGVRVAHVLDGVWVFNRRGKAIRLARPVREER